MGGNIRREAREGRVGVEAMNSVGSKGWLEAEHPAEGKRVVAGTLVLRQLGPAHIEGKIEPGHELGVSNAMGGPETHSRVGQKANSSIGRCLARGSNAVRE